jgi:copper(I)-binding protein
MFGDSRQSGAITALGDKCRMCASSKSVLQNRIEHSMKILPTLVMATACVAALAAAPARADIVVEQAWVRATVPGATVAAGYLVIRNTGSESRELLTLTSPVTDNLMIHRSSVDAQGVARMWPVGFLELEPGQAVKFEPNGLHLMFMALKQPLTVGQKVPVTFRFDQGAEPVTALLEVRPLVDAEPTADHSNHR